MTLGADALLDPRTAVVAVLTAFRVGGLVLLAPLFSARTVPMRVRTALVLALSAVLLPAALAFAPTAPALSPAALLGESLVGFAMGLGAALLVGAAEVAGDLSGTVMGLSGASIMDPLGGHPSSVLGQVYGLLAATLLLAGDGHLVMLDALGRSLQVAPVGGAIDSAALLPVLARHGSLLFTAGLQIAAPVIASATVATIALGLAARAVPQLNLMAVAFPVQIGVGLLALGAALPFLAVLAQGWDEVVRALAREALTAATGR